MNIFEFTKKIIDACVAREFVQEIEILVYDEPVAKLRASLERETFMEIFFNSETKKHSFALIKGGRRVFGVDNTRGWHIHPFENPDTHISCGPMSFDDFIKILEKKMNLWRTQ